MVFTEDVKVLSPLLGLGKGICEHDAFKLSFAAGDLITSMHSLRSLIPKHGAEPISVLVQSLANRLGLDPAGVELAAQVVHLAEPVKAKRRQKRTKTGLKIERVIMSTAGVETRSKSFKLAG